MVIGEEPVSHALQIHAVQFFQLLTFFYSVHCGIGVRYHAQRGDCGDQHPGHAKLQTGAFTMLKSGAAPPSTTTPSISSGGIKGPWARAKIRPPNESTHSGALGAYGPRGPARSHFRLSEVRGRNRAALRRVC